MVALVGQLPDLPPADDLFDRALYSKRAKLQPVSRDAKKTLSTLASWPKTGT